LQQLIFIVRRGRVIICKDWLAKAKPGKMYPETMALEPTRLTGSSDLRQGYEEKKQVEQNMG
jgi:hypothetical protein